MGTTTRTFAVKGMTCEGCQAAVTRVLKRVAGVRDAVVDLQAAQARVTFDPDQASLASLASAVAQAGYELVTGEPPA
jgi:copper chaperone